MDEKAPAEPLQEAMEKILALDMSHDIFSAKAIARAALANERRGSPEVQMGYPTSRSGESPEAVGGEPRPLCVCPDPCKWCAYEAMKERR